MTGMLGRLPDLNNVTAAQLQAALARAKASAKPRRLTNKQAAQRGLKRTASAVAATHSDASAVAATHSDEYEVTSQLAKCTCPWPCTVIKDAASFKLCVARVKLLDEAISAACPAWGQDTKAYVHSFLRWKLIIGELCSTPVLQRCMDWSDVSLGDLKIGSLDQDEYLDSFPATWTAEDVSLFSFHRKDWAMFLPLFACLFGEVVQKTQADPDALVSLVESEAFGEAAKAHHERYGIGAHPYTLVKGFGAPESWPLAKPRSRAGHEQSCTGRRAKTKSSARITKER